MSKVTETVTALAAPVAAELGLELWDVEYVREAGQWFLRVYIDKDGGVFIKTDVAAVITTDTFGRADDNGFNDFAFFDHAARCRFLNTGYYNIANVSIFSSGTAKNTDAQ